MGAASTLVISQAKSDATATKAAAVLAANDITAPLVNVFDIAAAEGIAVRYRIFKAGDRDVSGFYFAKDKTIYLNADEPAVRQAFTIAHELGHYFLGHKTNEYGVYRRSKAHLNEITESNEIEADQFAANLLMPEPMVRTMLAKYPFLLDVDLSLLARRFGVSTSAINNRLRFLGYDTANAI
jgi:Zn-dependent peptidase ImmA (M78 family)